jgi:hypothetical protein
MSSLLRPLTTGEILDGAFGLYRRKLPWMAAAGVNLYAPFLLLVPFDPTLALWLSTGVWPWLLGALIWQSAEIIQGREPRIGRALLTGLKRYFPFLANLLLYGLMLAVLAVPSTLVVLGAMALWPPLGLVAVLLLLPLGLLFLTLFFAWQQVVVLERGWDFPLRSPRLARGAWFKIAFVTVLGMVIAALPGMAVNVGSLWASGTLASLADPEGPQQSAVSVIGQFTVNVLVAPFSALLVTLLYFERRVQVDGLDVERSVEVLERSLAENP